MVAIKIEHRRKMVKPLFKKAAIILISLAVLILLTAFGATKLKTSSNKGQRQAVFTTSGQVYFGYVENKNASMVEIKDVYYITTSSSLYPSKPEDKISLIRMGSEVYKPSSSVFINRDHIMAIQDITKDSQINAAIASAGKK